ncbi:helix-turn-helix domain-containing protein [Duganella aceris]|uniref:helix-turn-helix domain-containing protein n=1 Tax=Duganella aceris TaxID=2703883 RepID=UPI003530D5F6
MNSISSIRARLGVTQMVMADALAVTQGNVSHYERGQRMPPDVAARLIRYAQSMGHRVTFDEIYGMSALEDMQQNPSGCASNPLQS